MNDAGTVLKWHQTDENKERKKSSHFTHSASPHKLMYPQMNQADAE